MSQHISTPTKTPILNGNVACLLTFAALFSDATLQPGKKVMTIVASPRKPVLLKTFAEVTDVFNAGTANLLTVGTDAVSANQIMAAADITEGTLGFYPASNAIKKVRLIADTDIFIKYNGGASATGTITSTNTAPADGSTVTIIDPTQGITETYTFKTTLSTSPAVQGEVLINTTADAALLNLIRAINHTGTAGTDYTKTAASLIVSAASSVTSHAFAVTALTPGTAGNLIQTPAPSTSPASHMTWGAATLGSGTSGTPTTGNALIYFDITPLFPSPSSALGV